VARFSSHFDTPPEEYERGRAGHLQGRRVESILTAVDASGARVVAELGCGTGAVLRAVAAQRPMLDFEGFDLDDRLLAFARESTRLTNVAFARADIAREVLPRRYDMLFSIDTIHHLHGHATAFRSIRVGLRPRGTWLAIEPNIWHPYVSLQQERMRRAGLDEDHFRPRRLLPLLEAAGFHLTSRRYLHAVPGGIGRVPRTIARIERSVERLPAIGAAELGRNDQGRPGPVYSRSETLAKSPMLRQLPGAAATIGETTSRIPFEAATPARGTRTYWNRSLGSATICSKSESLVTIMWSTRFENTASGKE